MTTLLIRIARVVIGLSIDRRPLTMVTTAFGHATDGLWPWRSCVYIDVVTWGCSTRWSNEKRTTCTLHTQLRTFRRCSICICVFMGWSGGGWAAGQVEVSGHVVADRIARCTRTGACIIQLIPRIPCNTPVRLDHERNSTNILTVRHIVNTYFDISTNFQQHLQHFDKLPTTLSTTFSTVLKPRNDQLNPIYLVKTPFLTN